MDIAIIPARGGSKRIPGKNIKDFCGRPIIAYSIRAAIESGMFDEVMVSTDDEQITFVARQYGAVVPFMRSDKTAGDYSTTVDVLVEVLEEYRTRGKTFCHVCCLYPTAPFVTTDKLSKAMNMLASSGADALIPVIPFSYPPQRGLILENGRLKMKWPENLTVRSQDLDPLYHDSGQFYIIKAETLLKENTLFADNTIPLPVSELEAQDIDNETDWKLAELKYRLLRLEAGQNEAP